MSKTKISINLIIVLSLFFAPLASASIELSDENKALIGQKIWQSEAGGTISGLTHWNKTEGFASLGIGHFIWFPEGKSFVFKESFPGLIIFLQSKGVDVPTWMINSQCPWPDLKSFNAAKNSKKMNALRDLLASTITLQIDFIVLRSQKALEKMLNKTQTAQRARLSQNFYAVTQSPEGTYALIDYTNFKGEGTLETEKYKGQGWGLRDVLLGMSAKDTKQNAVQAFSDSAQKLLRQRVKNGPESEARWLPNWLNRVSAYPKKFR